jgi:hypothetical protein
VLLLQYCPLLNVQLNIGGDAARLRAVTLLARIDAMYCNVIHGYDYPTSP